MMRGEDVKGLRSAVGQHFKVYDVRWDLESVAFFCDLDPETLDKEFDELRRGLLKKGYIPMMLHEGGEYIVYITEKAPARYRSVRVNVILLLATICTTVFVGAMNWWSYDTSLDPEDFLDVFTPIALGNGALFFAFPLMLILGIHETGHYLMARYHGVAASLPFFIPVPLPPLGTFGAFISMREPIPDKKALMDIGVAGPIAGFCVAVPVTLIGFYLTDVFAMQVPSDAGGLVYLGTSMFYDMLASMAPPSGDYLTHPTALAGWVGLLVTFLNLLPAGQLDGGHIARALFGDKAKYFSYVTVFGMLILAFYFQYFGWILFIFIIVFIGIAHPPPLNDITPLDTKRWLAGAAGFIILVGCFTPVPLYPAEIEDRGLLLLEDDAINMEPNSTSALVAVVSNTGNVELEYTLKATLDDAYAQAGWWACMRPDKDKGNRKVTIAPGEHRNLTVTVRSPEAASIGDKAVVKLVLIWKDEGGSTHRDRAQGLITVGLLELSVEEELIETAPGLIGPYKVSLRYLGEGERTVWFEAHHPEGWGVEVSQDTFEMTPISGFEATATYWLDIPADEPVSTKEVTLGISVREPVPCNASNGTDGGDGCTAVVTSNVTITVKVLQVFELDIALSPGTLALTYGTPGTVNVSVTNLGNGADIVKLTVVSVANLSVTPDDVDMTLGPGETISFDMTVEALVNRSTEMNLLIMASSTVDPAADARGTVMVQVMTD